MALTNKINHIRLIAKMISWLGIVFSIAVFTRIFLFELMLVPSDSMKNTLLSGDIIIMGKLNYGTRFFIGKTVNRGPSFSRIKRGDVVIFNYPIADTILDKFPNEDYYYYAKLYGRKNVVAEPQNYGNIVTQKIKDREQFVKRCIGLPGDTIQIFENRVFVNYQATKEPAGYIPFNELYASDTAGCNYNFEHYYETGTYYRMFPHDFSQYWTESFVGPLYIPKAGETVQLNKANISLYERVISAYEKNNLRMVNDTIFINGQLVKEYTFRKDYYYVLGDNRCCSKDSRYWGFVPKNHIKGKAVWVLCSFEKYKLRWNRIFKKIE